ncbi:hypothetical protein ACFVJ4_02940 [Streptomyces sp. NPDC127178]|uniref:hypothetical protein n=1 Tax=unclassified Streptomyces TaxID=2593676 RepID=UPI003632AAA6
MTYRFVARAAGVRIDRDHDRLMMAGVAEGEDGSGFSLLFSCRTDEPDEQDVSLGSDTTAWSRPTRKQHMDAYGRPS